MSQTTDINPTRRTELEAHKALLEPIIRGLHDKILINISEAAKAAISHQITAQERRLNAVNAELGLMDQTNASHETLVEDGYPAAPSVLIDPVLLKELQDANADEDAALGIFKSEQATSLNIALGAAQPKPAS